MGIKCFVFGNNQKRKAIKYYSHILILYLEGKKISPSKKFTFLCSAFPCIAKWNLFSVTSTAAGTG